VIHNVDDLKPFISRTRNASSHLNKNYLFILYDQGQLTGNQTNCCLFYGKK